MKVSTAASSSPSVSSHKSATPFPLLFLLKTVTSPLTHNVVSYSFSYHVLVFNILYVSRLSVSLFIMVYICIRVPGTFLSLLFEDATIATKTLPAGWALVEQR